MFLGIRDDTFVLRAYLFTWGNDTHPSACSVAILVVLDENHGALSWRAIMRDKKPGIAYVGNELLELDLSFFLKSLIVSKNLNCNDI